MEERKYTNWSDFEKELTQDTTDILEIKDQDFSEYHTTGVSGVTVHRPIQFINVTFPGCLSSPDDKLFSSVTFTKYVDFRNCSFPSNYLSFTNCTFEDDLTIVGHGDLLQPGGDLIFFLAGTTARGRICIRDCKFNSLYILPGDNKWTVLKQQIEIDNCTIQELSALKIKSRGPWIIQRSHFKRFDLSACHFLTHAIHLADVTLGEAPPETPKTSNGLFVIDSQLSEFVLSNVKCHDSFTLFRSTIDGPLRLNNLSLCGQIIFESVNKGSKGECEINTVTAHLPGALEPIYRYAKVAYADRGNLDAAGEFYYLERKAHTAATRSQARWWTNPFSTKSKLRLWIARVVGEWLLGYGEKPLLPLCWALGTVFLFALLFWLTNGISQGIDKEGDNVQQPIQLAQPVILYTSSSSAVTALTIVTPATCPFIKPKPAISFIDSCYFSMVTFTTLGYGDLTPNQGLHRVFAATEAFLGVTLMSLFLVTLARRFMR